MGKNSQKVIKGSKLEIKKNLIPGIHDKYLVYIIEPGPHKHLIAGFRYLRDAKLWEELFVKRYL